MVNRLHGKYRKYTKSILGTKFSFGNLLVAKILRRLHAPISGSETSYQQQKHTLAVPVQHVECGTIRSVVGCVVTWFAAQTWDSQHTK